ncbi:MAG: ribonuclease H-like domain-containing protein [Candidatus Woesearchaeota archaeon]
MIRNSFIFLKNVGYSKERMLWNSGILNWNDFLDAKSIKGISKINKEKNNKKIIDAEIALKNKNLDFFKKYFPKKENWRFYRELSDSAIFLDIETDNFSRPTVVSITDGYDYKTLIRGFNLDFNEIQKIISNHKLIVTFNGLSFDLRILSRYVKIKNSILLDLRPVFVRLGYNKGLKEIEKEFGIKRSSEVEFLRGEDAIFLWDNYLKTRNKEYLKLLVEYNYYDSFNLKPLAEIAYKKMKELCFEREIRNKESELFR